jgi:hypothetical protein
MSRSATTGLQEARISLQEGICRAGSDEPVPGSFFAGAAQRVLLVKNPSAGIGSSDEQGVPMLIFQHRHPCADAVKPGCIRQVLVHADRHGVGWWGWEGMPCAQPAAETPGLPSMAIKSPAPEWNADRGLGFYTPAACDFVNRQSLQEFCIEFVTVPFCQHSV